MESIHINCDLGEGQAYDADLMPMISACNIACGGHAGTLESMMRTVALAIENNVEIGAHPSYPDKENFGRRSVNLSAEDLRDSLVAQILSLKQIAESEGGKLTHIKPHGALYNDAARDKNIAETVLESVLEFNENWSLYVPQNSVLASLASRKINIIFEAFADRHYNPDYSLVSREKPNALLSKKEEVFDHLFSMFSSRKITCINGQKLPSRAATFCLHSDTPNSVEILQYLSVKFKESGVKIRNT